MKNIIKLVKSSPNDINVKGENGQYDLLQFLNSPITIDDEHCDGLYEKSNIGFENTRHKFYRLLCFLLYISLKLLSLSIFLFLRVCKIEKNTLQLICSRNNCIILCPEKNTFGGCVFCLKNCSHHLLIFTEEQYRCLYTNVNNY